MKHEHEPNIQLNGMITCRTCGEILPYMEEDIAKVDSALKANRILQELAVAGNYRANSWDSGFVLYSRDKNANREELAVKKGSKRNYRVVKRVVHVEE